MTTKKSQKKPPKKPAGRQVQTKRGKDAHELSEESLDKVSGGVGQPRPRSVKKGGVADDSV